MSTVRMRKFLHFAVTMKVNHELNNGFKVFKKSYRVSYKLYKDWCKSYFAFSEEAELVEGVAELPGCDHFGLTGCIPQSSRVWVM